MLHTHVSESENLATVGPFGSVSFWSLWFDITNLQRPSGNVEVPELKMKTSVFT